MKSISEWFEDIDTWLTVQLLIWIKVSKPCRRHSNIRRLMEVRIMTRTRQSEDRIDEDN